MPYVACTPMYAAPEVLRGRIVTPQADMWAWALVALELLQIPVPPRPARYADEAVHAAWARAARAAVGALPPAQRGGSGVYCCKYCWFGTLLPVTSPAPRRSRGGGRGV